VAGNVIGHAVLNIVAGTENIQKDIAKAVVPASKEAGNKSGTNLAAGMARGLADGAKVAVGTVATVGTAIVGLAATGGFARAIAIDNAQAKLKGLGHDTQSVKQIMDNALASVKGTAFGLGDAAGVAASVVAAGIKPGKDLEGVLKTVADTATIAGASMGDMGLIFGSVAARGKLQGDDLMQLQSRGVPVLMFLAEHYGITAKAASEMVSKGKVDFENFAAAMQEGLGGAALKSGETFMGAMANLRAALGRVGAMFIQPAMYAMRDIFVQLTGVVDNLATKLKPLAQAWSDFLTNDTSTLAGSFVALLPILGLVGGALAPLLSGLPIIGGAFASLTGPIGAVAGALIALVAVDTSTLAAGLNTGFDAIIQMVQGLPDVVSRVLPVLVERIAGNFPLLLNAALALFDALVEAAITIIPQVVGAIIRLVPQIIVAIVGAAPQLVAAAYSLLAGLIEAVPTLLASLVSAAGTIIQAIVNLIPNLIVPLIGALGTLIVNVVSMLPTLLPMVVNAALALFTGLVSGLLAAIPALLSALFGILPPVITALLGMLPQLLGAAITLFMGLVQAVISAIPQIIAILVELGPNLTLTILGMVPQLLMTAIQLFVQLVEALVTVVPQVVTMLVDMLPKIVTAIVAMIPTLLDTGLKLFIQIVTAVVQMIPQLLVAIVGMLPRIVVTLIGMIPTLLKAGIDLFKALIDAAPVIIPELVDALKKYGPQMVSAIISLVPALFKAGVDIVRGLMDGIASLAGKIGNFFLNLLPGWIVGPFKAALGIHSPSRLFRGFGVNIGEGLVQGMESMAGDVSDSALGLANAASDGFGDVSFGDASVASRLDAMGNAIGTTGPVTTNYYDYSTSQEDKRAKLAKAHADLRRALAA
jgi:tape measure domain-containing protein